MCGYNRMNRGKRKLRFFVPLFIPLVVALVGYLVMVLWNAILPEVAHAGTLSFWQALGLLLLCRILFGGFHFRGRGGRPPFDKSNLREKWMNMTEEERAQFKARWRKRWE